MRARAACAVLAVTLAGCSLPARAPQSSVVQLLCDGLPCCNAFELETPRGPRLVTAAHCVRDPAAPVSYLAYGAHVPRSASVESLDPLWDRAELVPAQPLPALEQGPVPPLGVVWAVSGWAGWRAAAGQELGAGGDYTTTTLNVAPGWSGSPVLDVQGRAIGILVRCETLVDRPGAKACIPHSGIFVALP